MDYEQFKTDFKYRIKEPKTKSELNALFNLPDVTIFRYLKKAIKEGFLLFLNDRTKHPRKFPVKVYFINNLKQIKK